ncbi:MAG: hypothetical protein FWH18_07410 [Marinilabiliaceae bacterium]|nr:hypothetical protein [Marinilabiliaceae bacterium]
MEYTIRIKQNPVSGWLIGQCEEIPEVITQGKDMDELMMMIEDAIELALKCRRDEFNKTFIDSNTIVRKLIVGKEKKFVDEMIIPETSISDINKDKVNEYIEHIHQKHDDNDVIINDILYQNLGITKNGQLTLGGLLFFAKKPQKIRHLFCVKAISFYGNSIGGLNYRDSRDIIGTLPDMFLESLSFFRQNLKHVQRGQNFNAVGILEISEIALEELIQNALIHRDYTQNSPIRLMIFDNRIEIISPGCLPNNLTVEKIKLGYAVVRNNLIASYSAKLLRYRGFGSGIIRAVENQPNIELINDDEGNQFIVKIPREEFN